MSNFENMRKMFPVVLLVMGLAACSKTTEKGSNPPQITFISVSPEEFKAGEDRNIVMGFKFSDKDADVGSEAFNSPNNIFIKSTLDTTTYGSQLPIIPPEFRDPEKGIEGVATVSIPTVRLSLDSAHYQTGDTFHFEIYIHDQAGHPSNTITTSEIIMRP